MSESKKIAARDLAISLACFVLGIIIGAFSGSRGFFEYIVFGAMIGGLMYGWNILTFITPNVFLILPLIGWVIYFAIKLVIALIIAPFAFVVKTVMNIIVLCSKD